MLVFPPYTSIDAFLTKAFHYGGKLTHTSFSPSTCTSAFRRSFHYEGKLVRVTFPPCTNEFPTTSFYSGGNLAHASFLLSQEQGYVKQHYSTMDES
jgi:hypothetical protein